MLRSTSRRGSGDLFDYEAVGQSTFCGLRPQALFGPYTPLSQTAGCAGQTMPPSPHSAAGFFGRSVRGHTVGSHSTIRAQARVRRGDRCAGPATSIRHAAHSFGHPPAASRLGYKKVRADATGSRWRPRWSRANAVSRANRRRRQVVAAGTGSARHGTPSRSMAQQRTRSFRATAMMACFLRAFPRLSRL